MLATTSKTESILTELQGLTPLTPSLVFISCYVYRIIESRDKVDVEKLSGLQWRTIGMILEIFPFVEFSPYVHELLFHSAQLIGELNKI